MRKLALLFVAIFFVTVGCQPKSTLIPQTPIPLPTATLIPPTATPLSTLTMIINENKCTFDGPKTIPNGVFTIDLTINEKIPNESGFSLITLEKGRTIEDLRAWRGTADQPPSWVITLHGVHEMISGAHTYAYDSTEFAQNASDHGGPYYLMCFRANPDTGKGEVIGGPFGPIEFTK